MQATVNGCGLSGTSTVDLFSGSAMLGLFVVFAVPLWGFGVLAGTFLLQAFSIVRLTQRIRRAERT
jgi:hypothetical protein